MALLFEQYLRYFDSKRKEQADRKETQKIVDITQLVLKGTLTNRIDILDKTTDIGKVQVLFNSLLDNFHNIVSEVKTKSEKITSETKDKTISHIS